MDKVKILLVDDDTSLLRVMEHHLTEAGYNVNSCSNGKQGLLNQKENPASVVFTDLKMPEMNGIEFINKLREFDTTSSIVVITGFPTIDSAVDAMKSGALDFIQKPVEKDRLLAVAKKAVDFSELKNENRRLRLLMSQHLDFGNMIGHSKAIQHVYQQGIQAANSNATVLITGETGTGKEMLAKAIHSNSRRNEKPFITVNCAAVPVNLIESELFGHVKGAFTGAITDRKGLIEEAKGGTFFLDEIGDLPLELQPKLLRVLQDKEFQPVGSNSVKKVDIRFIVATHRNLNEMIQNNTFREDLFFRLNVIPIKLPTLKERKDDILPLFSHFLQAAASNEGKQAPQLSEGIRSKLEMYDWPGNIRELENLAQRIIALCDTQSLTVGDLPEPFNELPDMKGENFTLPETGIDLEEWIDRLVIAALKKNNWNQSKTASYLNISRNTLVYRVDKRQLPKG